jgi:hypothetical protein
MCAQVVTNMRGESAEDVAQKLIDMDPLLAGLQGPTVARVFSRKGDGVSDGEFYGVTVCIPKNRLYESVKKLRSVRALLSYGLCVSFSHDDDAVCVCVRRKRSSAESIGLWDEGRHAPLPVHFLTQRAIPTPKFRRQLTLVTTPNAPVKPVICESDGLSAPSLEWAGEVVV